MQHIVLFKDGSIIPFWLLLIVEIGDRIMKYFIEYTVVIFLVVACFGAWYYQVHRAKGQTFTYAGSVYECVVKTNIGDE